MDPRRPELALARVKELIKRYNSIEKEIGKAEFFKKIGQLEREGALVIQELCLTSPRLHDSLIQASRQRRRELNKVSLYESTYENNSSEAVVEKGKGKNKGKKQKED